MDSCISCENWIKSLNRCKFCFYEPKKPRCRCNLEPVDEQYKIGYHNLEIDSFSFNQSDDGSIKVNMVFNRRK